MFAAGSGAVSVFGAVAVAPRREPRRRGVGLASAAGSAGVSPGVVAADSVVAVSAGSAGFVAGVRAVPRAPRRLRGFRVVPVVAGFFSSVGCAGVGSGVGAAATAGSGGYSMRAPAEEPLLPFLVPRAPVTDGSVGLFSFSLSKGPPAIGSKAPPK